MDPVRYLAAKARGQASIIKHDGETILVSMPGGYDPVTGDPLPPQEVGYQRKDIVAMRTAAEADVASIDESRGKAQQRLEAFDTVLQEIEGLG